MKVSWEESRRHGERERLKADRWMRQREEVRMVEPGERKGTVDAGAREKMRNVTEGHWQERRRERERKCRMKGAMRAEGWSVLAALKQQR